MPKGSEPIATSTSYWLTIELVTLSTGLLLPPPSVVSTQPQLIRQRREISTDELSFTALYDFPA